MIDGHHRWAASVAIDYTPGKDLDIPVYRIDTDIITALNMANEYAAEMGIPQVSVSVTEPRDCEDCIYDDAGGVYREYVRDANPDFREYVRDANFDFREYRRWPKGDSRGGQFAPEKGTTLSAQAKAELATMSARAATYSERGGSDALNAEELAAREAFVSAQTLDAPTSPLSGEPYLVGYTGPNPPDGFVNPDGWSGWPVSSRPAGDATTLLHLERPNERRICDAAELCDTRRRDRRVRSG